MLNHHNTHQGRKHFDYEEFRTALEAATTSRTIRLAVLELMNAEPDNASSLHSWMRKDRMTQGQQGLRSNCGNHHEDNKGDNQIHRADNDFLNHCQQFTSILTEFSSESKIVNDAEASELITIGELDDFYEQIENAWWQSLEQRIEVLEGYARLFRQAQNKIDMWSKTLGEEQGSLTRSSATSSVDLISHHLAITKLQIIASELDIIYLKSLNAEHVPEASSTTSHPNSMGNLKALFTDLPAVIKHSIHMDFSVPYEEQFGNLKNALSAQIKSRFLAVEDLMTKLSSMNVLQTELIEYDLMLSHLVVQFFENEACLRVPLPATLPDLDIGSAQVDHDHNRSIKFEQSVHKTLLLRQLESEGLESLLAVIIAVVESMSSTCSKNDTRNSTREFSLLHNRQLCTLSERLDNLTLEWQEKSRAD